MSLLTRMASAFGIERRTDGDNYWSNFAALRTGTVSPATAQSVSSVYACVSAIAETTASLPLILYRRTANDDRERASDHPLYRVLHDQANDNQSAIEFREWMQACVLLRGNGYARIVRGWDGQVRELLPLAPDRVQVLRAGDRIAFDVSSDNGQVERLLPGEVFHLRHRAGDDPFIGVSPIQAAREVIELAIAERDHGNATFKNGAKLGGILSFPGKLKNDQRDQLKTSWSSQYSGANNSGRTPVLEEGMTYQSVSMTLEDAEWIEARKFSVLEMCRLFRCPPVIVQSMESANYSNSVELARQFVTLSLRRHLVAWEQAIARQLLTEAGRRVWYAEHEVSALLRGDSTNRADFYDKGIAAGWMLKSEARRLENLPVIEGIDDVKAQDASAALKAAA